VRNGNANGQSSSFREIPRAVWALGFVSLLTDVSSEIIHALLPVYLVTVFGASMLTVGFIKGIAEATASITKVFSGALSDWLGKRKMLALIGNGLAAITKLIFPLAPSVSWLVSARFIDRIGKGIRGPLGMPWWPILRRRISAARASDCCNRLILSGPSLAQHSLSA
jgi:Na+/melibiose symporter-like transporter